ncbi:MAG: hypothetical protein LBG60_12610 [Bifidobacteriaceae bacterium]|jgi:hypothetical protein|nr:hypothetical protein [Bifidobacteriaceae bacterium]
MPAEMPESRAWIERPDLPLDYYADLVVQADLQMSSAATADNGAWEIEQEKAIADCMKRNGFEYHPRQVELLEEGDDVSYSGHRLWIPWLADDIADVERWGYGYSYPETTATQAEAGATAEPDPNEEYVASLSSAAQDEYRRALMGADLAEYYISESYSSGAEIPEMGGCWAEAIDAVPSPVDLAMQTSPTTVYEGLISDMRDHAGDPYGNAFSRREEVDALDGEWRECFAEAFPSALPGGDAPSGVLGMFGGPTGARELAFNTNADGQIWDGPYEEIPMEYASLTATAREVAIAVRDFECRVETNYVERFLDLEREAQEAYIGAHRAELDEMAAALQQYIGGSG